MNINDYIPTIKAAEMFVKISAVMIVNLNGVNGEPTHSCLVLIIRFSFFSINQVPQIDQMLNLHVPQKAGREAIDLNVNPHCTIMLDFVSSTF